MISDRDRQILAETERQIHLEDPGLAGLFETGTDTGKRSDPIVWLVRCTTSIPVIVILLLILIESLVLEMGLVVLVSFALATAALYFRIRREREG